MTLGVPTPACRDLTRPQAPTLERTFPCSIGSMIRVGSIVLRVEDLKRQTEFWSAALDYVPRPHDSDDFVLLWPRDGIGPNLALDMHHSEAPLPPRIHLDLYADDQAQEVERLRALGATEVHWDKRPRGRRLRDPRRSGGKPLLRN